MIRDNSSYDSEYSGGLLVIRIKGEIDHHSAVGMRQGIDAEIVERRPEKLIMDLSSVNFMDSSGLGLILGRYSAVRQVGGELVVVNPNKGVMKILKLAGTERIIKIEMIENSAGAGTKNKEKLSAKPKGRRK